MIALAALGRLRARRADPGVAAVLDEALALADRSGGIGRLAAGGGRAVRGGMAGRPRR